MPTDDEVDKVYYRGCDFTVVINLRDIEDSNPRPSAFSIHLFIQPPWHTNLVSAAGSA